MAQIVVPVPVETPSQPYGHLGGLEGLGRKGGYYNIEVHFPKLLSSPLIQRWLRKRQPATKAEYLSRFEKFLDWTANQVQVSTPEQFLAWAKAQPDGITVQDLIDQYAEGKTKSNAHIATAAVRSFLNRNGYRDLPKIDWESTVRFSEGYKRDECQRLIGYLNNPLWKLYALAAKDSGLRPNDLLYVRYGHVKQDFEAGQRYVHIRFEDERYNRKKAPGRSFLGPNTLTVLRDLINAGKISTSADSKLFPFAYRTITKVLVLARTKAGIKSDVKPSYGFRKFFEACLDRVGMDRDKKWQIEGHSSGVRKSYTSRDIDDLRDLYGQTYKYLDLSEQAVVSNEVGELQKKLGEQELKITALKDELSKKDTVIPQLIKRMERLEQQIAEKLD